jgi:squalene-associated FAD-dependent desaturase
MYVNSHSAAYDVIVIGGGLSGLSAAVELAVRGARVLLVERRRHLGGRTYSFIDDTTGDVVDNGQHLLMGCYHQTRRYLTTIGSEHLAELQPALRIDFLHPERGRTTLQASQLPSPLHVLTGLFQLKTMPVRDRLKLINVGMALLWSSRRKEERLAAMTVDEWLASLGQSETNRKYLWDIIAIGSLNDDPRKVSALPFFKVLEAAFMGTREDASLMIPRVGLSELLCDPAERLLKSRGSEVRLGSSVEEIMTDGVRVSGVLCSDGSLLTADAYISAVPWHALNALVHQRRAAGVLLPQHQEAIDHHSIRPFEVITQFASSPIITINVWFDRPVMEMELAALLESRVQWVFNRSRMLRKQQADGSMSREAGSRTAGQTAADNRQYLSMVISGAAEYVEMEKGQLVAIALEDLGRVFPAIRGAGVVHSLVIKEKRATFSPVPGLEKLRPSVRTPFENFFLAGDWTDTGYPSTIEGAVMSGRRAAEEIK